MKMRNCLWLFRVCAVVLFVGLSAPYVKSDDKIQTVLKVDGMNEVEHFTYVLFNADSTLVNLSAQKSGDTIKLNSLESGKSYILVLGTFDELYAPATDIAEVKGQITSVRGVQALPKKLDEISNRLATIPFTIPQPSQLEQQGTSEANARKTSTYIYTLPDVRLGI